MAQRKSPQSYETLGFGAAGKRRKKWWRRVSAHSLFAPENSLFGVLVFLVRRNRFACSLSREISGQATQAFIEAHKIGTFSAPVRSRGE
jgi:hypothetical protein